MLRYSYLDITIVPVNGVDAVQTITTTGAPTGGTYTLTFGGQTTTALPYNSDAPTVQAALQALSSIGAGNIICTGGPLPTGIVCTFAGSLGGYPQATMTFNDGVLTGGATPHIVVTATTTGVEGTYRGVSTGCTIADATRGIAYVNSGSSQTPIWGKITPT